MSNHPFTSLTPFTSSSNPSRTHHPPSLTNKYHCQLRLKPHLYSHLYSTIYTPLPETPATSRPAPLPAITHTLSPTPADNFLTQRSNKPASKLNQEKEEVDEESERKKQLGKIHSGRFKRLSDRLRQRGVSEGVLRKANRSSELSAVLNSTSSKFLNQDLKMPNERDLNSTNALFKGFVEQPDTFSKELEGYNKFECRRHDHNSKLIISTQNPRRKPKKQAITSPIPPPHPPLSTPPSTTQPTTSPAQPPKRLNLKKKSTLTCLPKRIHGRLRQPMYKVSEERKYEKYCETHHLNSHNELLSITEFLENPRSLVRVQSYDTVQSFLKSTITSQKPENAESEKVSGERQVAVIGEGRTPKNRDPKYTGAEIDYAQRLSNKLEEIRMKQPPGNEGKIKVMEQLANNADDVFEMLDKYKKIYKMDTFMKELHNSQQ